MRRLNALRLAVAITALAAAASAHAFLDHASPPVGSTLRAAPPVIKLWFTQELEPAFSTVEVTDQSGHRVDAGDAQVDGSDATLLHATLRALPPGNYKVTWRVVSVDTHPTDGTFTFHIGN